MQTMTATYSPDDNKLRLYSSSRLDSATYERVKAAGFKWAPRQELFVAPMWTPAREDLLLDLCGEIGDEDTSLVERAEERADRFGDYSDKRASDAESARRAVSSIADGIPFGQPILVGHHSERRARKDAERIENGMRRAVKMWETSEYWKHRAAGALRHAKYKELPAVRHRRIKGLEADKRKQERAIAEAEQFLKHWRAEGLTLDQAKAIANYDHISRCFSLADYPRNPPASQYEGAMSLWSALDGGIIDAAQARDIAIPAHERTIAWARRWLEHYENRIAYERAMLDEQGGLKAEGQDIQPGGRVLIDNEWLIVVRVNKKDGKPVSVTTNARYVRVRGIEEIKEYQAPTAEQAALVEKATKLPPLVNYPGEGFAHMTKAEYDRVPKDYKGTNKIKATDTAGAHRVRTCMGCYCMPKESDFNKRHSYPNVFITDAKRVDPPAAVPAEPVKLERVPAAVEPCGYQTTATTCSKPNVAGHQAIDCATCETGTAQNEAAKAAAENPAAAFQAMRDQLKAGGVQVVSAPQLFPTPARLAARMVELADIEPGMRVLEPSAGTGRILDQLPEGCEVVAVEINASLGGRLDATRRAVVIGDFLQCTPETLWGSFDRILMNPPFANADDIKHIRHALDFLKPGGKLVAICANGPRQNAQLRPLVEQHGGEWEDLPPDTFADSGTAVNTALFTLTA